MNIILFGPPGAGKGTQAENIAKYFNFYKISTGDLLRNEIYKKTTLGNEIKSTIAKGSLVSDKIINNLIEKILSDKKYHNRIIFDGYPRNLEQAKNLDFLAEKYGELQTNLYKMAILGKDRKNTVRRVIICLKGISNKIN